MLEQIHVQPRQETTETESAPAFRIDVPLYTLLQKSTQRSTLPPSPEPVTLPEPVFPQIKRTTDLKRSGFVYHANNGVRAFRRWLIPYMQSRVLHDQFRPLLSYLFTEWKCNLDCHYCWAFDNSVKGMSEEVAKRSIDFLHSVGCRVTAIMGGEPLLRPKFIHKVISRLSTMAPRKASLCTCQPMAG
jgi:sulfatase maturation enzyme AslB (radical SAM superfamily)